MIVLGAPLARGRTSDVYSFGPDSVVKVLRDGVPNHWAAVEAEIAANVHQVGLPTPEVREVTEVNGRPSIVFERIYGPSMWEMLLADPGSVATVVDTMIDIQTEIHRAEPPPGLDCLGDRLSSKISDVKCLTEVERETAESMIESLPAGSSLCHGDLHPGNILMGQNGPVIIDWFDAVVGDRVADQVRTSLLIRSLNGGSTPQHLPGASSDLLAELHATYLDRILAALPDQTDQPYRSERLLRWERVLAAARLSERTDADHVDLLALWRCGDDSRPVGSELAAALRSRGLLEVGDGA